jgi:hypothetical protein
MRQLTKYAYQRRVLLGVSGLVVATALAIGVALAVAADSNAPPQRPQPAPVVQTVSPAITAELAILNRAATPADALPAGFEGNPYHWLQERRAGANGALARRARMSRLGVVFLIPSSQGVCMLNVAGTENICATPGEVALGEAEEAILCSPSLSSAEIEIGGILPDGTTTATVALSNGTTIPLAVEGNIYIADFPRSDPLPTKIEWISADGRRHTTSAHVPAAAASERCVKS